MREDEVFPQEKQQTKMREKNPGSGLAVKEKRGGPQQPGPQLGARPISRGVQI